MPNRDDYLADIIGTFVDLLSERPSHEGYDPADYGLTTEQAADARLALQPRLMELARHIRGGVEEVPAPQYEAVPDAYWRASSRGGHVVHDDAGLATPTGCTPLYRRVTP